MIGGKVLDASALAAHAQGSIATQAHLAAAEIHGSTLYLSALAFSEARWVFPDRLGKLGEVLDHTQVLYKLLEPDEAPRVAALLTEAGCFDACAGHVILVARERGWPVLTTDPGRLTRIAPDLDLDLL